MYNYPGSGHYSRPPGYSGYPASSSAPPGAALPPGMAGPPGMAPPGSMAPHGAHSGFSGPSGRGSLPGFQPPAGMPNINFNAPVIRLGTTGPQSAPKSDSARKDPNAEPLGSSSRRGLGADSQRQQRDPLHVLQPPSREEVARTIFVGDITEGSGGDEGLERIMRCAGNLRKWNRIIGVDGKPLDYGFAEYEDAQSLETAIELFGDIEVPVHRRDPNDPKDDVDIRRTRLLVITDEASVSYAKEWKAKRDEDEAAVQFRFDTAREALAGVLKNLSHPEKPISMDTEGDIAMGDGEGTAADGSGAQVITIPLSTEDELADIPPDMRATVAAEIAAFRERSNRRDMERLKREEEIERQVSGGRYARLGTPPSNAPSGPAAGANGIPLGPREKGVQGAPSGPKGMQGVQIPKDYQAGVTFVNGGSVNGIAGWISREDESDPASDEELERRRQEKKAAEQEKQFLDQERKWLNRERGRTAALQREKNRDVEEEGQRDKDKADMAKRLKDWNDDKESSSRKEEYYRDRSAWIRNRSVFRQREIARDNADREAEERENARDLEKQEQARGMADSFLSRQAQEMATPTPKEPQRFRMQLGTAVQKAQAMPQRRRTAAEVEGLLEDEEETTATTKRKLRPIQFDSAAEAAGLSEEDHAEALKQLAESIPADQQGLWGWEVKWEFVDEALIAERLRPFVEKKVLEYLGVQEQMLVDLAEEHIRKKGSPEDLVKEFEETLDEEAEALVRKLWRLLIFYTESEKRGLST